MRWVNKETELYGSFAKSAGNVGCQMMNSAFYYYGMNKIYKSFSVDNIKDAIDAVRILDIKGFAITMPYKIEVISLLDSMSDSVREICACNTVLNQNGVLVGHNTDSFAAEKLLSKYNPKKELFILGSGGYSRAVQYAAKSLGLSYSLITKSNWDDLFDIKNSLVYNCTPVDKIINNIDNSNEFVDCLVDTKTGRNLANIQAGEQFKLYTERKWPFS